MLDRPIFPTTSPFFNISIITYVCIEFRLKLFPTGTFMHIGRIKVKLYELYMRGLSCMLEYVRLN